MKKIEPLKTMSEEELYSLALVGLACEFRKVSEKIDELRDMLPTPVKLEYTDHLTPKKRELSPEARERIAEAQRKRWRKVKWHASRSKKR